MRVLDDRKRRTAGAVRLALITLGVCLLGFCGLAKAGGQGTTTVSHSVAVKSEPSGATIWKKDGRDFTCMNALTPGTVDLTFHGEMDVQRIKLRRFGYAPKVLDVKSTDKELEATLDPKNYETSFLLTSDAPPDLQKLNDALRTEFGKTLLFDQEAFRCAPYDLYFIHLTQDKETGAPNLDVALRLDRSFGGPAFRLASHAANSQERHQKMGQVALENGMGEVLGRFHRVAAKFPELKVITVLGFYSTTEAVLDTERVQSSHIASYVDTGPRLGYDGNYHYNTLQLHTVQTWNDETVVKDQTVEKAITFIVPAAKIPDSLDKKAISDAVLAEGQVILAGNIEANADPSHAIVKSAGSESGGGINIAAGAGDLSKVQALLKAHPELISSKDAGGDTPLHNAVAGKAGKAVVEFLLASNADVSAKDNNGWTPLRFAAFNGDESMAELLLAHKAEVDAKDNNGETTLLMTALVGTPKMAECLLANKADVNTRDAAGRTPLHYAALGGRPEMVQVLLAHGADVNATDMKGKTPMALIKSTNKSLAKSMAKSMTKTPGQKEAKALLREAESSQPHTTAQTEVHEAAALPPQSAVAPSPSSGEAEIHKAAMEKDFKKIRALLKDNPNLVSSKDPVKGNTPLLTVINQGGSKELVEFLLASNADANAKNNAGYTPLHFAALGGRPEMVQVLLAHNADVNAKDNEGWTPLQYAAGQGLREIVEVLLAHNADINAKNKDGWTPLHHVVGSGKKEMVEVLLAHKADIEAKDNDGRTPLHFAAAMGKREMVEVLLAHNAQIHVKDNAGETPLDMAVIKEQKEVAALLRQAGSGQGQSSAEAEIQKAANARDLNKLKALLKDNPSLISSKDPEHGYTPLHTVVIAGGITAVVEFLLANKADVNAKDDHGWTPLRYAVNLGDRGVAELLLSHHADIDARDDHDGTALHVVAWSAPEGMVEFLLANKADVNAKDDMGRTPLHYAAAYGKAETVQELLDHKADVNAKDKNGMTPLAMAENKGQKEIAGMLRQYGAGR
jgi:ankyrin repeat protein